MLVIPAPPRFVKRRPWVTVAGPPDSLRSPGALLGVALRAPEVCQPQELSWSPVGATEIKPRANAVSPGSAAPGASRLRILILSRGVAVSPQTPDVEEKICQP